MKKIHSTQEHSRDSLADMLNDCSIDRVMAIDTNWKIIAWNRTAEVISGRKKDELLGTHLLEAFPELSVETEMLKAIETAMNGKKAFVPAAKTGFNRVHYENHFIPLSGEDAQPIGVMNIMHDVAHRVKAEQELHYLNIALQKKYQQLERASSELSTFTYITSKNIKEPVRQLYTGLEYLVKTEGRTMSDMGKANLRRMQSSLNRMNLLVDDILALSKIDGSCYSEGQVDLNKTYAEATSMLQSKIEESGAQIEVGELPVVNGNNEMLQTVIYQLLDNSIKFQPPGSTPKIKVEANHHPGNAVNQQLPGGPWTEIRVTDNGIGFDQQDAERMFKMFEKLNEPGAYKGSGMGLAICRKIMDLHDGVIKAKAEPGKGSTLSIYLPASGS